MIFWEESGDIDTEPSYLCDAELDDETIGKSSPLFIQEREEPADRRQTHHSHEESLLPAQSFFTHTRTVRPVHELSSLNSCALNEPCFDLCELEGRRQRRFTGVSEETVVGPAGNTLNVSLFDDCSLIRVRLKSRFQ